MVPELSICLKVEWHQIVVVNVLELPLREPDVIAICHGTIGHLHAKCDNPVENMKCIRRPGFTVGQIDNTLRTDTREGHPLQPFVDVLVIIAGCFDAEDIQHLSRSKSNRVSDISIPGTDIIQQLLKSQ